jgi:ABC-type protease/lipase transport system fused ATPase/permease subunit
LGIIGPSASGKSTLARALVAAWPALQGSIQLDDASIDQWSEDSLGRDVGYVPQDVQLFEGTIAQNIARFDADASSETVLAAAERAGAHGMIVGLAEGYNTLIGEEGVSLSVGQRQRIALARALYNDPFLVVLDEPNSNLDAEGDAALNNAILSVRQRGGIVVIIAHRPFALTTVDHVLILSAGHAKAFGPKSEVLRRTIQSVPVAAATESPGAASAAASQALRMDDSLPASAHLTR